MSGGHESTRIRRASGRQHSKRWCLGKNCTRDLWTVLTGEKGGWDARASPLGGALETAPLEEGRQARDPQDPGTGSGVGGEDASGGAGR